MNRSLALLAYVAFLIAGLIAGPIGEAGARERFVVAGWHGMSAPKDGGRFSMCIISRVQRDGMQPFFYLTRDGRLFVTIRSRDFNYRDGQSIDVRYRIDGRYAANARASAVSHDMVQIEMPVAATAFRMLQKGNELIVRLTYGDYSVNLAGTAAALERMRQCVWNRLDVEAGRPPRYLARRRSAPPPAVPPRAAPPRAAPPRAAPPRAAPPRAAPPRAAPPRAATTKPVRNNPAKTGVAKSDTATSRELAALAGSAAAKGATASTGNPGAKKAGQGVGGRSESDEPTSRSRSRTGDVTESARRVEAVTYAANLLARAGFRDYRILHQKEMRRRAGSDYDVVWSTGVSVGALKIFRGANAKDFDGLAARAIVAGARSCKGGFRSGVKRETNSPVLRFFTQCDGEKGWHALYALVRGKGDRVYLLLSLGNGLSDKEDGAELRSVDNRLVKAMTAGPLD